MSSAGARLVLDTNQIVGAGSRWIEGPLGTANVNPHRRLLVRVARDHTGLYCDEMIDEYLEKLLDRGHPEDRARKLIVYLRGAFEQVVVTSEMVPVPPPDPDDEIFLLCSLDGDADYLVSEDADLLVLGSAYERPAIMRCSEALVALGVD